MKIKEITIGGVPHIVGIGNHETGYGHFITFPAGRNVRADYLLGGFWSNVFKQVTAEVVRIELDTDELKPFTDYFAPMEPGQAAGTAVLAAVDGTPLGKKPIQNFTNESAGPRFDHYYAKPAMGNSGENLNATALALHILIHFGAWVLNDAGEIIQPVTFRMEIAAREDQESPYSVMVIPVDGVGPFEFSTDGQNWNANPEIVFPSPENATVFVRDSAGTKASAAVAWPVYEFTGE